MAKKLQNIKAIQKMLDGTHAFQTKKTHGFTDAKQKAEKNKRRKIGEVWEGHSYQGKTEIAAPTLTWTTSSINNATAITGTLDLSDSNNVYTFQLKNQF